MDKFLRFRQLSDDIWNEKKGLDFCALNVREKIVYLKRISKLVNEINEINLLAEIKNICNENKIPIEKIALNTYKGYKSFVVKSSTNEEGIFTLNFYTSAKDNKSAFRNLLNNSTDFANLKSNKTLTIKVEEL